MTIRKILEGLVDKSTYSYMKGKLIEEALSAIRAEMPRKKPDGSYGGVDMTEGWNAAIDKVNELLT